MAFLLLRYAAGNHKAQSKEAEDEGIFLRFGDDLAVDDDPQRRAKSGSSTSTVDIEGSRIKVSDGFVDQARSHPRRSLIVAVKQVRRLNANSPTILNPNRILIHKETGNGSSASAGNSDSRRVGGAGGKSDVGLAAARNSGGYGLDVIGVGTRKQGRDLKDRIGGLVSVVNVCVTKANRVLRMEIVACGGSDGPTTVCGKRAAKNQEGLAGGVVLGREDVQVQLRLALFERNKKGRKPRDDQRCCKATIVGPLARLSLEGLEVEKMEKWSAKILSSIRNQIGAD